MPNIVYRLPICQEELGVFSPRDIVAISPSMPQCTVNLLAAIGLR